MSPTIRHRGIRSPRHARGLSLIELMISLVLGLLVLAAAIGVFASNRQTYVATESLGRVQENARVAFELMAREVREAAGNACGNNVVMNNVVNSPGSEWWRDFGNGILGVDGMFASDPANRVAGTDALELKSTINSGAALVEDKTPTSAGFFLNADHGFVPGDILMVCDYKQAVILQMTTPMTSLRRFNHNTGTGIPGNCTQRLGFTGKPCTGQTDGGLYTYKKFVSRAAKLHVARWYVGTNPRGGRSLYQSTLSNNSGTLSVVNNEITEGVQDMQITYLLRNDVSYVDATAVGSRWNEVLAARIVVTLEGQERIGTDGNPLERQLVYVATLRNRNA